ncbi:class I SAM-dependent methyltransferase family protein [Candidatus Woesearchaeota archaeon]|nr:MAG: class I SAM-dependent methyltransferase family protein [Candidatus Woesearchaeota archaeon]
MKKLEIKGLTEKELSLIPKSFDVVGDMLIFSDFPPELEKKEKIIGEAFLNFHKNVKVVLKKIRQYSGEFRTPKLKIIAGERRKETIHTEHGCRLKLNPEKAYFSSRLSTERKRIYQQVKKGESVLVMFSGVAPYPVVIAKNSKPKEVYGIEINPLAHKYAEENIKLNKLSNVKLFCGDVRKVLPKINKKFDRIIMPLPKGAEHFLGLAFGKIKKNGIIHFYDFLEEKDIPKSSVEKIKRSCKASKKKCRILRTVKCGQYSPYKFRVCVDFKVI